VLVLVLVLLLEDFTAEANGCNVGEVANGRTGERIFDRIYGMDWMRSCEKEAKRKSLTTDGHG
jgi:hypothetical protein